ncbi:MAG: MATE family efflux transporter, partial [Myxococcota bacterium]
MPGRKGPIDEARRLLRLAWPVVVAQLGMVFMGAGDLWMGAPLGEAATASLGLGNTYSFGLVILGLGAATGIDPLVTQAYGAGRPQEAGAAALHGLVLVGLLGVPLTAFHLISPTVLGGLGQPPELLPLADTYCSINAIGIPAFLAFAVVRQWLQGDGVMRPAMLVIGAGNAVNLLADALLVAPYGIAGVAWSTVIVRWSMLVVLVWLTTPVLRRSWPDRPSVRWGQLARLATIALPVSLQNGLEIWAFSGATVLAGFLGPTAIAAHVSAINVVALAFMAATGLSAAAATRVGN